MFREINIATVLSAGGGISALAWGNQALRLAGTTVKVFSVGVAEAIRTHQVMEKVFPA